MPEPETLGRVDWMPRLKVWRVIRYKGATDIPAGDYNTKKEAEDALRALVAKGNPTPVTPEVTIKWLDDATKAEKIGQESVSFGKTPERIAHNNPRLSGYIYEPIDVAGIKKIDLSSIDFADFREVGEVRYYGNVKVKLVGVYEAYHTREGMVYRTFDKNHRLISPEGIWNTKDIPVSGKDFPEAEYHLTTKNLGDEVILAPFMPAEVVIPRAEVVTPTAPAPVTPEVTKGNLKTITERLGKGETLNNLLPMSPEDGPPLPRMLDLKWPWKK